MANFYKATNEYEKSEAYNRLRALVKERFSTAELYEDEYGYCILWYGIFISEVCDTPYDAWHDVALPY